MWALVASASVVFAAGFVIGLVLIFDHEPSGAAVFVSSTAVAFSMLVFAWSLPNDALAALEAE